MRYLFTLIIISIFLHQPVQGQVVDKAAGNRQNSLPVEGGAITMNIDSKTPLKQLISKLNNNWNFIETGKAYWIGYTADMFSIASRGNAAIPELLRFFYNTKNERGKTGAIYTLHLIGIHRNIAGRFSEKFVNPEARAALLKLLPQPEYAYTIANLLKRDPLNSDIHTLFDILHSNATDETCWPIINILSRYQIPQLPITSDLPDSVGQLTIKIKVDNENSFEPDFDFSGQIKLALRVFKDQYPDKIVVEENLYKEELSKYYNTKLQSSLRISDFLSSLEIGPFSYFSYLHIGCKLQYYFENGKLYFCTIKTARERVVNWWLDQAAEKINF